MITEVLMWNDNGALDKASALIRDGALVGIPTETVYGLGANAYNAHSCLEIFKAKGRPADNPLIVHIAVPSDADKIAYTNDLYYKLAERFMPGPLTIILPKRDIIPSEATAGLDSVAIRCPVHEVARQIIERSGVPIAAPSANKSGRPSPTSARHVYNDMNGIIPLIIDAGPCDVGVESTVIKISEDSIIVLRPGAITAEMLREVCDNVTISSAVTEELKEGEVALSPGMKYKHYAPASELYLVDGNEDEFEKIVKEKAKKEKCAVICYEEELTKFEGIPTLSAGKRDDIKEQTKRLFELLRRCDELGVDTVYAHLPSKDGQALAMYNRMIRACAHRVIGGKNG
ncbi:MAG: threonylcarbamoyl-AMP synthase [Ruminococcaceae bacterium]|nr:threonylcarbamoyl-AMP synthase [Oscillospiraceae bacterium]